MVWISNQRYAQDLLPVPHTSARPPLFFSSLFDAAATLILLPGHCRDAEYWRARATVFDTSRYSVYEEQAGVRPHLMLSAILHMQYNTYGFCTPPKGKKSTLLLLRSGLCDGIHPPSLCAVRQVANTVAGPSGLLRPFRSLIISPPVQNPAQRVLLQQTGRTRIRWAYWYIHWTS